MSETMGIALLSFAGTLLGTLGGILAANRLTNYRIERLEKQVEKHNQVIDRVYKLEQADAVEEEELKVINHRIRDLEKYHK
ncbi:MAG: hypothetical protein E7549_02000 [Ruminococcaceae bacterium]|nr:hypothetical protein [Oscillospiraceae bacterium]